jgi:hypothetical protein
MLWQRYVFIYELFCTFAAKEPLFARVQCKETILPVCKQSKLGQPEF